MLEESLAGLPEQERRVLELHWGWDGQAPQTFTQIGQDWRLSRQRIHQIHTEALILLRTPGLSIRLRSLSECHNRKAYRAALQKNWKWQRSYRRRG
jgi:DNA-directed RNA polymerase sigma subunit (sigma70/sigma32)